MKSIRDIYKIGKGPSSSHTMGPARAAQLFKDENPAADLFEVRLYGSLSKTGVGHGTDRVLREVLSPVKTKIIFRDDLPADAQHPNTLDFTAWKNNEQIGFIRVESIGGGDIRHRGPLRAWRLQKVYPGEFLCRNRGVLSMRATCQPERIRRAQRGPGDLGLSHRGLGRHVHVHSRGPDSHSGIAARRAERGAQGPVSVQSAPYRRTARDAGKPASSAPMPSPSASRTPHRAPSSPRPPAARAASLPAVLKYMQEEKRLPERQVLQRAGGGRA